MQIVFMKNSILFLLFLWLIVQNLNAQNFWRTYELPEYHFEIDFKEPPLFSGDTSSFEEGEIFSYYWENDVNDTTHPNVYYAIGLDIYPPEFIHSDSSYETIEGFLNSSQYELLDNDDFTLITSELIELNGYPGKKFNWRVNSNYNFLEFRVFLVKNYLYIISTVTYAHANPNSFINKYFDSFKLTDVPDGNYQKPIVEQNNSYQVDFPGQPTTQSKTVDSEMGQLQLDIQMFEPTNPGDNLVFISLQTNYPQQAADENDPISLNALYKRSIDGSLSAVNAELISILDIEYQEWAGKEFKAYITQSNLLMVYRLFYIDNNMYSLGVITFPENDNNEEMEYFFNSFKIIADE